MRAFINTCKIRYDNGRRLWTPYDYGQCWNHGSREREAAGKRLA
jgi:hypothetical protein